MNGEGSSTEVVMRQKSSKDNCNRKELSLIEEERLSKLEFEENERLFMVGEQPDSSKVALSPARTESRIPVLKPTPVKSILKGQSGSNRKTITAVAPRQAASSTLPINQKVDAAACHGQEYLHTATELATESAMESADHREPRNGSGLEYLEQTIREADQAIQQSMGNSDLSENYTGLRCVDIDIGESINSNICQAVSSNGHGLDKNSFTPSDSLLLSTSTTEPSSHSHQIGVRADTNAEPSNGDAAHGARDCQLPCQHPSRPSSHQQSHHHETDFIPDIMTRSAPLELLRSTPSSLPSPTGIAEYRVASSPHSPGSYVWTSNTLPLDSSPADSPKHRLSQSGSPTSPTSGRQTIVYVPVLTNTCKCCSSSTHRTDPLRDLVSRRRRKSSYGEDDRMSMASSIDSEVARYLVDYRSESGSNVDVLESRNSISLCREDKIQKALLVMFYT